MISRKSLKLAVIATCFFLLTAFVQPLPLIFNNMQEKIGAWKSLKLEGTRLLIDHSGEGKIREDLQVEFKRPGLFQIEVADPIDGTSRRINKPTDHLKRFSRIMLLAGDKAKLFKTLYDWGVSPEPLGLSRIKRRICQIIGAREGQLDRSQFWIDKFEYTPARLFVILEEKGQNYQLDIVMSNWDSPVTDGRFPQHISFLKDGRLIEEWRVTAATYSD